MLTGGFKTRAMMESALEEGALDVIGVARAFCIDLELGRHVLADAHAVLPQAPSFARYGSHASFAEMAWYSEQLQRLGAGLPPSFTQSTALAMLRHLWRDFSGGLRASRRRRMLQPPATPLQLRDA